MNTCTKAHRRHAFAAPSRMAVVIAAVAFALTACDGTPPPVLSGRECAERPPIGEGTGFVRAADKDTIVDANGDPLLLRCVAVAGWLDPVGYFYGNGLDALTISSTEIKNNVNAYVGDERGDAFWTEWEDNYTTEADVARMAELGLNCIRLPLLYRGLLNDKTLEPLSIREEGFARVDQLIEWSRTHGVTVILDMHGAPGGQNGLASVADVPSDDGVARLWTDADGEENRALTTALWRYMAERYRDEPVVGGYDLLNEPQTAGATADRTAVATYYRELIEAIREIDQNHALILEGDEFATNFNVFEGGFDDDNLIYQFHFYAFLRPELEDPKVESFQAFFDARDQHCVPLWLGEFGEQNPDWVHKVITIAEDNGVGWAWWPWKRRFIEGAFADPHPTFQNVALPESFPDLFGVMIRGQPDTEGADIEAAMADMIEAIRIENCTENEEFLDAALPPLAE